MSETVRTTGHIKGERCRGKNCKALIVWTLSEKGVRQPVDLEPNPQGNLVLTVRGTVLLSHVAGLFDPPGVRYMPHHATCPDAENFKR